jgi:hypothetical protein
VTGDGRADLAVAAKGENSLGSITLIKGAAAALNHTGVTSMVYSDLGLNTGSGAAFGS